MFERFIKSHALDVTKKTAVNLMSDRGEANARSVAKKLVDQFKLLNKADQILFLIS